VSDSEPGAVREFEDAEVRWSDGEIETLRGPVKILSNGWVETPETGGLYPPKEVVEVLPKDD